MNQFKIKTSTTLLMACFLMFGCRNYYLYHYDHLHFEEDIYNLELEMLASRKIENGNNGKVAIEGNPYSLIITVESRDIFDEIAISNLRFEGVESGSVYNIEGEKKLGGVWNEAEGICLERISFSDKFRELDINHEDYIVSFNFKLSHKDKVIIESKLKGTLRKNYKEEARSDIIGGIMGI